MFDVRLMRWIDNQVGNVACSALAVVKRVRRPFHKDVTDYRKILVTKFFGMGSIVVASPALAALREAYPDAEIHFVSFSSNDEILEILAALGLVDRNWLIDTSSPLAFVASMSAVARELRSEKVDLALDLEFSARLPLVFAALAGISRTAGFVVGRERWRLSLLDVRGTYNPYFHTKDIFLSIVYLLTTGDRFYEGFEPFADRYRYPRVDPGPAEHASIARLLAGHGIGGRPLMVLNANTSADLVPELRRWPADRYVEIARRLLEERPDAALALIGTPSEAAFVRSLVAAIDDPRAVSVAGEVTLRELVALLDESELVVTNDSGPMHLACLVDAPVVGLFFADTPVVYGPLASRAATVSPPLYAIPLITVFNGKEAVAGRQLDRVDNTAARAVTVDQVLEQCRAVLSATPPARATAPS